jgi:hypothetical protein
MSAPGEIADAGPRADRCSVLGCTAYAAFGFTFPDGTVKHACTDPAHREAIAEEWEEARRQQAAAIAAKMKPAQGSLW